MCAECWSAEQELEAMGLPHRAAMTVLWEETAFPIASPEYVTRQVREWIAAQHGRPAATPAWADDYVSASPGRED